MFCDKFIAFVLTTQNNFSRGDILISGLMKAAITNKHLDSSTPYNFDDLTWCVGKAKLLPTWQNIYQILDEKLLWLLLVFSYYILVVLTYLLQQYEKKPLDMYSAMLISLLVFVNFAPNYRVRTLGLKFIYMWCFFSCIVCMITVNSFFQKVLKSPIRKIQVQSIEEIINERFELAGDQFSLTQIKSQPMVNDCIIYRMLLNYCVVNF